MELRLYFRMLQRGWWIITLTALMALNVTLVLLYMATPQFRATARFLVVPSASLTSSQVLTGLSNLDKRSITSTYAEILSSDLILSEATAALGVSAAALADYTPAAVVLPDASVLELSITGPDPEVAQALANQMGERAIVYAQQLNQIYELSFLDQATAPAAPVSPVPARDISLALALGLVLGAVLAVSREQLRLPLETLRRLTITDGASAAYTRRHFQRTLEDELARPAATTISLGLIRLDGLRDLIDNLPPVVVQRLLHHVTRTLQNELRGNDSVGRWDDISFSVLLPATPQTAAARTLDRIQQALSRPVEVDQQGDVIQLLPFVGVATGQASQTTARTLMEQAEAVLERARQAHDPQATTPEVATVTR
ncbi:MAG: diguanylate cyclase [Anaerolineales bacterium]|nr:diguanylate cyclase [Anaerolineales bacterium]